MEVVTAFQRHFRPARVDGVADHSTMTTLHALLSSLPADATPRGGGEVAPSPRPCEGLERELNAFRPSSGRTERPSRKRGDDDYPISAIRRA